MTNNKKIKSFAEFKKIYYPKNSKEKLMEIKEPKAFGKALAKYCFQKAVEKNKQN
jgi:hypothetical protein